ncbi:MAG: transporter substrate-binding domain-containing protein [Solobacterium sp.]|nr:transporter substrate-binding domain-containing protein [Solobacterium sp.]
MNRLFRSAIAAAALLSLTACGTSTSAGAPAATAAADAKEPAAAETAAAEPKAESKTILIGISPDYPPYDDLNADGSITGYDYDMGEWIFNWLSENGYNYKHEWKQMSFDTIISALQADQVDLGISGFTYDSERKVLFSEPYHESAEVALVTKDSALASIDDLTGKTIGAQLGTTGETCANEIEGAKVQAIEDMGICVESLKGGAYDAVIMDLPVAENYMKTGDYKILEGTLLDEQNYIIAKEGNDELMDAVNEAIRAFLESDDCAKLNEKYGL